MFLKNSSWCSPWLRTFSSSYECRFEDLFPYACPMFFLTVGCYELPSSNHVEWRRGRWMLRVQETGLGWHPREICWEGRWDPVTLQLWRAFFICHQKCLSQINSGPWKDVSSSAPPMLLIHQFFLSYHRQTTDCHLGSHLCYMPLLPFHEPLHSALKLSYLGGHSLGPKPI